MNQHKCEWKTKHKDALPGNIFFNERVYFGHGCRNNKNQKNYRGRKGKGRQANTKRHHHVCGFITLWNWWKMYEIKIASGQDSNGWIDTPKMCILFIHKQKITQSQKKWKKTTTSNYEVLNRLHILHTIYFSAFVSPQSAVYQVDVL